MALAQDTDLLLLDEPTTFLDLSHQIDVLDLLVDLNQQHARTIVLVLHDLNHAARYADHLIAMREGSIVAEGDPPRSSPRSSSSRSSGCARRSSPTQSARPRW